MGMYSACVPPCIGALEALGGVLDKAAAWAEGRKIDPAVLLGSRMAPDMFPLARQVQVACDMAKNGAAYLAAVEPPKMADDEASFAELRARIGKTVAFLRSLAPESIDGGETRVVTRMLRGQQVSFEGMEYLTRFVLPNVYFHCAAAYMILRHNGLDVGKRDFLGSMKTVELAA